MKKRTISGILATLLTLVCLLTGCGNRTVISYDTNATAATNATIRVNQRTLPTYTIPQATVPTAGQKPITVSMNKVGNHGQVDMTPIFNKDVFSDCSNPSDGGFDDQARHMGTRGVSDFSMNGVPFHFGSFADGQNNAMFCNYDDIVFAKPFRCDSIQMIVSSKNGDYGLSFFVEYTDGTFTLNTIWSPDWCNKTAPDRAYTIPHAHLYDEQKNTWETNHERYLFMRELDVNPNKLVKRIVIGEEAKAMRLHANVAIFAMTAVNVR